MEAGTPRRMVIRRTSPRGERRRHVVVDGDRYEFAPLPVGEQRTNPPRTYAAEALPENQPRWSDLVPIGARAVGLWMGGGVLLTLLLVGLDQLARQLEAILAWPVTWEPLHLDATTGIAAAVRSLLLLLAAGLCGAIAHLRRYRIDDYRGRYRSWYTTTIVLLLASLDQVAFWHRPVTDLIGSMTANWGWHTARSTGTYLVFLLVAIWLGRLAWRVRSSRGATIAIVCCLGMGGLTCLSPSVAPQSESPVRVASLLGPLSGLIATELLFAGLLAYTRFVLLEAQGLMIVRRTERPGAVSESEAARAHDSTASPHTVARKSAPANRPASPEEGVERRGAGPHASENPAVAPVEDLEQEEPDEDLSETDSIVSADRVATTRAERKRLKKEQQRAKRAA